MTFYEKYLLPNLVQNVVLIVRLFCAIVNKFNSKLPILQYKHL